MNKYLLMFALACLLAACGEAAPTDAGADAGGEDADATADADLDSDLADAADTSPDAGDVGPLAPVLITRGAGDDIAVAYGISNDCEIAAMSDPIVLPGLPTGTAMSPDAKTALVGYVMSTEEERGVVAFQLTDTPLRLTRINDIVASGLSNLRSVHFTSNETAVAVRNLEDVHQLLPMRRDVSGDWTLGAPFVFPETWPDEVHALPGSPGLALAVRFDIRDLRLPSTVYPLHHDSELTLGSPVSIDGVGKLLVHPMGQRAYLITRTGLPRGEHQTGRLQAITRQADETWELMGPPFALPNQPALTAVSPDGVAFVLYQRIQIDRDPVTDEPIFTSVGLGIDQVTFDAEGAADRVIESVASIEGDRGIHFDVLSNGCVVLASSIGTGPIEYNLRVFRAEEETLVEVDREDIVRLLRVATP